MRTELILACLGMTAATYLCRSLFTVSMAKATISPFWERFLAVIPFAVLSALVTPYLFLQGAQERMELANPYLLAGVPTLLVAWRTRNLILSVGVGMGIYLVLGMAGM